MRNIRGQKGQTVVPEYVVGFFVVIAALVAMSVFVQRAFQARVRDANVYMVDAAARACAQADASSGAGNMALNCQGAAGARAGRLKYEYEPYYAWANSVVDRGQKTHAAWQINSIYHKQSDQATLVNSDSVQMPPGDAN